jgi:hypothetical protein
MIEKTPAGRLGFGLASLLGLLLGVSFRIVRTAFGGTVEGLLKFPQGFSDGPTQLRQFAGTEQKQCHHQNENQAGYSDVANHVGSRSERVSDQLDFALPLYTLIDASAKANSAECQGGRRFSHFRHNIFLPDPLKGIVRDSDL